MPLKFSMAKCLHAVKMSMASTAADASTSHAGASAKITCKFRVPSRLAKKMERGFLRASDVVLAEPYARKLKKKQTALRNTAPRPNQVAKSAASQEQRVVPSVLDMLADSGMAETMSQTSALSSSDTKAPSNPMKSEQAYIADVTAKIASGKCRLNGDVWILPPNPFQKADEINDNRKLLGERLLNADEVLVLVQLPCMFVWAPEFSYPGLQIHCPSCDAIINSSNWWRPKILTACAATLCICAASTLAPTAPRRKEVNIKSFLVILQRLWELCRSILHPCGASSILAGHCTRSQLWI